VSDTDWTTRLEHTGETVIHQAWFIPNGWPGAGTTVNILLPECEFQVCWKTDDGRTAAAINRPQNNKSQIYWIKFACREAVSRKASIFLSCDTPEQVAKAVKIAARHLPNYKRMPLERVYRAEDRKDAVQ
jgi:hypothetical protein